MQVQVVWIKETDPTPREGSFPAYIRALESELVKIVGVLPGRFPNVRLAYLSSRTYGGWAKPRPNGVPPGNSEPYSYETGFAVKWLIQRQLQGDPALSFDSAQGQQGALAELGRLSLDQRQDAAWRRRVLRVRRFSSEGSHARVVGRAAKGRQPAASILQGRPDLAAVVHRRS